MNNSHWIVFFVQRDVLPQFFKDNFASFTAVEVLFDFIAICVGACGISLFYKVQYFHFNLAAIWFNAFIIALVFILSRFILIPFEFGLLHGTNIAYSVIVNVSTFRFILWIALYHFELLIVAERIAASYFVATYEKNPRRYISAVIIASNYVISATLGYLVVYKIIHGFYYLAFVLIAGNMSYLTFLYVHRAGKRRQKKLLEQYRGYSVSYRWQLKRNIAADEDLSILMFVANATVSVVLPCIFVPAFILQNDTDNRQTYEVAKLMLQLLLSISFGFVYIIFVLVVSKHRQWIFGKKPVTDEEKHLRGEKLTADAHISRLQDTWNAKLDSKTTRK